MDAIERQTLLTLMALISIHFFPTFFSFAIESYLFETDFTRDPSQNYHS